MSELSIVLHVAAAGMREIDVFIKYNTPRKRGMRKLTMEVRTMLAGS